MDELMKKFYEKLPEDGIQRTDKKITKKGYDTTGYGYQWVIDRLNDVSGFDWDFDWHIIERRDGTYQSGTPYIEITVDVSIIIFIEGKKIMRHCVGGHTAINFSDALKGAITNGIKKTASFFGIGADAFRGEIDEDAGLPDKPENKIIDKEKAAQEAIEKLKALPENIRSGFNVLKFDARQQWQFCNDNDWNFSSMIMNITNLIQKKGV
jgi:hypothetical protein